MMFEDARPMTSSRTGWLTQLSAAGPQAVQFAQSTALYVPFGDQEIT